MSRAPRTSGQTPGFCWGKLRASPVTAGTRASSNNAGFTGITNPPLQQSTFPLGLKTMYAELARTATEPVFTNEPRAWVPFQEAFFRYIQIITARQHAPDELLLEYLIACLPEDLRVELVLMQKWQPQHK